MFVWLWLEVLGFCPPGEAHRFVEAGGIDSDSPSGIPALSGGGALGNGRMHGIPQMLECYLQLAQRAGDRQREMQRSAWPAIRLRISVVRLSIALPNSENYDLLEVRITFYCHLPLGAAVRQASECSYRRHRQMRQSRRHLRRSLRRRRYGVAGSMSLTSLPLAQADDPSDALMMGGTGMPTPSAEWMDSIIGEYIDPATGGDYTPVVVTTPEALPVDYTVANGLTDLQAAMIQQQLTDPGAPYVIEGYSQSALIAVDEERDLAAMAADGQQVPDVTVALFGSGNRPDGGIYERLVGLYVPGLEVDANGAEPTDLGIPTIDVAIQYDGLADVPQYPANLVADLNDVLGVIYEHTSYGSGFVAGLLPPSTPLAEPFTDQYVLGASEIVMQQTGDTTFYLIPTTELPLLDPLLDLGVPEPVLNIVQPALQVIVEAGYDRAVPFGDPTPFELIPSIDPATFTLEFANGVVQGADNAFALFGAQLPDFSQLESFFTAAEMWSEQTIGIPYEHLVSELNTAFDPFTLLTDIERPIGEGIEDILTLSGVQQDLLDPILGLIGPLGQLITG